MCCTLRCMLHAALCSDAASVDSVSSVDSWRSAMEQQPLSEQFYEDLSRFNIEQQQQARQIISGKCADLHTGF